MSWAWPNITREWRREWRRSFSNRNQYREDKFRKYFEWAQEAEVLADDAEERGDLSKAQKHAEEAGSHYVYTAGQAETPKQAAEFLEVAARNYRRCQNLTYARDIRDLVKIVRTCETMDELALKLKIPNNEKCI